MVEYGKRSAADATDEPPRKHFRSHDGGAPPLDPEVQARLDTIYADGLVVPGDLDERALELLSYLPANTALDALEEFAHADMARVRNKSAFFSGICNRFKGLPRGGPPGGSRHDHNGSGPPHHHHHHHRHSPASSVRLHPDVQGRLNSLYDRGALQHGQLDTRCLDALQSLPLRVCMRAIDRLDARHLGDIRNMSAFFMAAIKAAMQEPDDDAPPPFDDYAPPNPLLLPPPPPPPRYQKPPAAAPLHADLPTGSVVPPGMLPAGPGPASASSAPLNMAKRNYALDQGKLGVRTDEFHALSVYAVFVHPAPALKLQQLWDDGNPLVSLLDDAAWNALSELGAPEGLAVIEETASILNPHNPQDNISAVLVTIAQRYIPRGTRPMVNAAATASGAPSSLGAFIPNEPEAMAFPQSGYHDEAPGGYGRPNGYRPPQQQHGGGGSEYYDDSRQRRPPRPDVFRDRDRERQPGHLGDLPLPVQQKIEEILQAQGHYVGRHHFDEGVVVSLARVGQGAAIAVLEELQTNDLGTVRNVPAYIMGICKRYQVPRTDLGYIPPQQRM